MHCRDEPVAVLANTLFGILRFVRQGLQTFVGHVIQIRVVIPKVRSFSVVKTMLEQGMRQKATQRVVTKQVEVWVIQKPNATVYMEAPS